MQGGSWSEHAESLLNRRLNCCDSDTLPKHTHTYTLKTIALRRQTQYYQTSSKLMKEFKSTQLGTCYCQAQPSPSSAGLSSYIFTKLHTPTTGTSQIGLD